MQWGGARELPGTAHAGPRASDSVIRDLPLVLGKGTRASGSSCGLVPCPRDAGDGPDGRPTCCETGSPHFSPNPPGALCAPEAGTTGPL